MTIHSKGLFDLQVNGFAGVDFNTTDLTAEALDRALAAMLRTGVALCLPTLITAEAGTLAARFRALDAAVAASRLGPLMVPGYHLEGPFLNPADGYAGCHPAAAMIPADFDLVRSLEDGLSRPILLVTLAPEVGGAPAFIERASRAGKVVALGHSSAGFETLHHAVRAGARMSTHLGNGIAHQHHKFDNPLFAHLAEDELAAAFIADGVHVPPAALKVMLRAKGIGRSLLVTDAVAGAAAPPGLYDFAGMAIERSADGIVRLPGERVYLAGSALTLDQAVRNMRDWGLATATQALAMAADAPRTALAPALAAHGISLPESTTAWEPATLAVQAVHIAGKEVFRAA